jgi:hypothetical protein
MGLMVLHGLDQWFYMDGIDGFARIGSMVLHGWDQWFCMDGINVFQGRLDGNEGVS